MIVMAANSPSDGFSTVIEAANLAVQYMTPVIVLSDGYLSNSAENLSDVLNTTQGMVPVQSLILTMISKILKRMVAMSELWPDLGFYWELRVLRARRAGLKKTILPEPSVKIPKITRSWFIFDKQNSKSGSRFFTAQHMWTRAR